MKKILIMLLTLWICISFCSCNTGSNQEIESDIPDEYEQPITLINNLEFFKFMEELGFGTYMPESQFFEKLQDLKYEGESVIEKKVTHYSGYNRGGAVINLIKSGVIKNSYEKSSDASYQIYTNTLKTKVPLEGLNLPYEINFEDTLERVFEKMGFEQNPCDNFIADKNSKSDMILYKLDGELLIYRDLTKKNMPVEYKIPYILEYTRVNTSVSDEGKDVSLTHKTLLSFDGDRNLCEIEISVSEENGTKPEKQLPVDMPVFGRVENVDNDGIIVSINGVGNVYIKCSKKFELFDSVAVSYNPKNLLNESGIRPCNCFGDPTEPHEYEYTLIDLISIRHTDPSKGEPLYD